MKEYKAAARRRGVRQAVMAVAFLGVIVGGWFYPLLGYFIPSCMVAGLGLALFRGRRWCDWYCPRGSFYDAAIRPLNRGGRLPGFVRHPLTRLAVLVALMGGMGVNLVLRWPDPVRIGQLFVILLTATTGLGIALGLLLHARTWCWVCPIGTMSGWIASRRGRLQIDSARCTECKLCGKVCPVQLAPYRHKGEGVRPVEEPDCLRCGLCVAACPVEALGFSGQEAGGSAGPCACGTCAAGGAEEKDCSGGAG